MSYGVLVLGVVDLEADPHVQAVIEADGLGGLLDDEGLGVLGVEGDGQVDVGVVLGEVEDLGQRDAD